MADEPNARGAPLLVPAPPASRMTSKVWYVVAGGLIVIALAIGLTGFSQFMSTVEDMRRVAMPGQAEIVLPAGFSTLYVEHRTVVDGKAIDASWASGSIEAPVGLGFQCALTDPDGKAVPLEHSASSVSYSFGSYEGQSMFDLRAGAAGTYVLACEAPGPFGVAVGYGVGTWIVVAVVGGLVPGLGGVFTFLLVLIKRRRQRRRAAAAP